jgi:hypothetical protein
MVGSTVFPGNLGEDGSSCGISVFPQHGCHCLEPPGLADHQMSHGRGLWCLLQLQQVLMAGISLVAPVVLFLQ